MKKIICIGECSLNVVFSAAGQPLGTMPGGRIANAAAIMASRGLKVIMASEVSADAVGNLAIKHLEEAGVDTHSIDRYTEGRTPLNIFIAPEAGSPEGLSSLTRYEAYPDEAFDIVWPRIDEGDVVVFGGYYAIDARMRQRLMRLLTHAVERKAILIYLPGFLPQQELRITRVMPQILENLEIANVVVVRNRDLKLIFGVEHPEVCYHDHIDFYCRSMVSADTACHTLSYYSGKEVTTTDLPAEACESMLWNSGVIAGVVAAIFSQNLTPEQLDTPAADVREKVLRVAADEAIAAARSLEYEWQKKI